MDFLMVHGGGFLIRAHLTCTENKFSFENLAYHSTTPLDDLKHSINRSIYIVLKSYSC